MNRTRRCLTLTLLVLATTALAAAPDRDPAPTAAAAPAESPPPVQIEPVQTPLTAALAAVVEVDRQRGAELAARLAAAAAASDHAAFLAAQADLADLKSGTERRLLEVQAEFARGEGREDDALRIEAVLATLRLPPPAPHPQDRPAPAADAAQR